MFYNGRDHSTVCYAIQRIEALREEDAEVDRLLSVLRDAILSAAQEPATAVSAVSVHRRSPFLIPVLDESGARCTR
jgi:hypothetical protein